MKCSRCQGLVVPDQLYDPDGPYLHIAILRCLNCGETKYLKDSPIIPDLKLRNVGCTKKTIGYEKII